MITILSCGYGEWTAEMLAAWRGADVRLASTQSCIREVPPTMWAPDAVQTNGAALTGGTAQGNGVAQTEGAIQLFGAQTMDDLYETAADFEKLTAAIAGRICDALSQGDVVYAVLGSALQDAGCLAALRHTRERGVGCKLLGQGFEPQALMAAMDALDLDLSRGYRTVPAMAIELLPPDPTQPWLVCELNDALTAGVVKAWFSQILQDDQPVVFLRWRKGFEAAVIPLHALDRQTLDHTACVVVPGVERANRRRYTLWDLDRVIATLRAPGGCPWDREQTHQSLRRFLLEETYEVLDAIDRGDAEALADELGDVLLQVVLHADMGRAEGDFDLNDVISNITNKMIERHPHVFSDTNAADADEVLRNWEAQKRAKAGQTVGESLTAIPKTLPALMRVQKTASRLKRAGNPLPDAQTLRDRLATLDIQDAGSLTQALWITALLAAHVDVELEYELNARLNGAMERLIQSESDAGALGVHLDTFLTQNG